MDGSAAHKEILDSQQIADNFKAELNLLPDSPEKVWDILNFSNVYGDTLGELIIPILEYGFEVSRKIGYKTGEFICSYNKDFLMLLSKGQMANHSYYAQEDIDALLEQIKDDKNAYSYGLTFKAYSHWFKGEYDKGFDVAFNALKLLSDEPSLNLGWTNYSLGVFYFDTKDLENSELYYTRALETFETINYIYGIARSKNGIGTVAVQKKNVEKALQYLSEASVIFRELSHSAGLSRALNDLGALEVQNKNYETALELLFESAKLREKLNHYQGLITTYTAVGEVYVILKNNKNALEYFTKALDLSKTVGARQKRIKLHKLLANLYKSIGEIAAAYEHLEAFHELDACLRSDESSNNIKKIQTKFETEKAEQLAEIERLKNFELKKAYEIIESKNKDIHDSINYAKRIQTAILPSDADIKKCFDDSFVLYMPKDIVSGDFYWTVKGTSQKTGDTVSIMAAIDCTGHGVPGAFMSMIGNALLNQTIFNPDIVYPSDVLNYLNNELPKHLKSTEQNTDIKDGMDMALCSFNFDTMKLIYSGANNPCWIVRDKTLTELKADKHPISASPDLEKQLFTNKEFALQKGDMVYLFTDGYADQFGGPKGKKFKYKQLEEKLINISHLTSAEQNEILKNTYLDWKGDLEQIDDVLIIGIRV